MTIYIIKVYFLKDSVIFGGMSRKKILYWICQIFGWGAWYGIILLMTYSANRLDNEAITSMGVYFVSSIAITHLLRFVILRQNWIEKSIGKMSLYAFVSAAVETLIMTLITYILIIAQEREVDPENTVAEILVGNSILFFLFFIVWTVIYGGFLLSEKSRKQELKTLQLESNQKESELNNLKNQLNPHFMFNAMNSIRALIDEDPNLAKKSVTQLANLLRNTLKKGQNKLISFNDELEIVNDYLTLEKVRFEERLTFEYEVEDRLLPALIPPLLIQTLVENAIKHGISNLAKGGIVKLIIKEENKIITISLYNDGTYEPNKKGRNGKTGIGIKNAKDRLKILFDDRARLSIDNENGKVCTKIVLPCVSHYDQIKDR